MKTVLFVCIENSCRSQMVVVTMGCGDACPAVRGKHREDWNIPDPKGMDAEAFIAIRDLIRAKVERLIVDLSQKSTGSSAGSGQAVPGAWRFFPDETADTA